MDLWLAREEPLPMLLDSGTMMRGEDGRLELKGEASF